MFGEKDILNNSNHTLGQKGRITLPIYYNAETTDVLVILSKRDYIEVWNMNDYQKYLELTKIDPFTYSDQVTASIVNNAAKIDAQRRLTLGVELVKKYHLEEGAHIEGKGKFIRIWNRNKFEEYKNTLEEQEYLLAQQPKKKIHIRKIDLTKQE